VGDFRGVEELVGIAASVGFAEAGFDLRVASPIPVQDGASRDAMPPRTGPDTAAVVTAITIVLSMRGSLQVVVDGQRSSAKHRQ